MYISTILPTSSPSTIIISLSLSLSHAPFLPKKNTIFPSLTGTFSHSLSSSFSCFPFPLFIIPPRFCVLPKRLKRRRARIYIYIYIYICVCVCVCVYLRIARVCVCVWACECKLCARSLHPSSFPPLHQKSFPKNKGNRSFPSPSLPPSLLPFSILSPLSSCLIKKYSSLQLLYLY